MEESKPQAAPIPRPRIRSENAALLVAQRPKPKPRPRNSNSDESFPGSLDTPKAKPRHSRNVQIDVGSSDFGSTIADASKYEYEHSDESGATGSSEATSVATDVPIPKPRSRNVQSETGASDFKSTITDSQRSEEDEATAAAPTAGESHDQQPSMALVQDKRITKQSLLNIAAELRQGNTIGEVGANAIALLRNYLFSTGQKDSAVFKLPNSKDDFIETCMIVLAVVKQLRRKVCEVEILPLTQETEKQLEGKEILISVFGRFNSGKSTLLNTMLETTILPTKSRSETSVKVKLVHKKGVHHGSCPAPQRERPCPGCPRLKNVPIERSGTEATLSQIMGKKAISDELTRMNSAVRKQQKEACEYILYVNIPILGGVPSPWMACLVDTPGFGEAVKGVNALAERALLCSSAYVYVVNYTQLGDDVDKEAFSLMFKKDKDIFKEDRLLIICTHYDKHYAAETPEDVLPLGKLQKKIVDFIKKSVDCDVSISEEMVVPVCGNWAMLAVKLQQIPDDSWRECAIMYLRSFGLEKDFDEMESDEIADKLMEASGVTEAQQRIKMMAASCFKIWVENISNSCAKLIDHCHQELETKAKSLQDEAAEAATSFGRLKRLTMDIDEKKAELEHELAVNSDSLTYAEEYKADTEVCKEEATKMASKKLQDFAKMCKTDGDTYIQKGFRRGMEGFLEDISPELEKVYGRVLFEKVHDAYDSDVEKALRKFEVLKSTAEDFINSPTMRAKRLATRSRDDQQSKLSAHGIIKKNPPRLADIKGEIKLLPLADRKWWAKVCIYLEENFQVDLGLHYSKEEVDHTLTRFSELVMQRCNKYFDDIQPQVTQHFFKMYQAKVKQRLKDYREVYKIKLEQQIKFMDEMKKKEENCKQELSLVQDWKTQLLALRKHVTQKAREFAAGASP